MASANDIAGLIGSTPLVHIRLLAPASGAEIWAKLEGQNPGGSIKDRIGLSMIERAERKGLLKAGGTIIEPTSGNTGIGLAMVAASKGYKLILTMPDTMSMERRQMFAAYGAELVLTPGAKGMPGAIARAAELAAENPGWYMPQQFENPANPEAHRKTTALEILYSLGGHAPDGFVSGVGTGGTITGVGEVLRAIKPSIFIAAVEPDASPVLSGGAAGPHKIAGIGAGFVPKVLNTGIYDQIIRVTNDAAAEAARALAVKEGILCGISSGAAFVGAVELAQKLGKGHRVVVIFPDRGDRYLSTGLYSPPNAG